jgi:hypothetical protein
MNKYAEDNLSLYNDVRKTPEEAKKTIGGGRLKGFTDINPQYRIETLTKMFGPCGIGWYYVPERKWEVIVGDEVLCFVDISLYYKLGPDWSKPVHGTGGSALLKLESRGLTATDEGYKMATTDALSVACKQLGIGADVYWQAGESKYSRVEGVPVEPAKIVKQAPSEPAKVSLSIDPVEYKRRRDELKSLMQTYDKSNDDYKAIAGDRDIKVMTSQEFDVFKNELTNRWLVS